MASMDFPQRIAFVSVPQESFSSAGAIAGVGEELGRRRLSACRPDVRVEAAL